MFLLPRVPSALSFAKLSSDYTPCTVQAMVVVIPTVIQDGYEQTEPGPRCSTCEQVKLDEWINWQKCWSDPYIGGDDEPRILAHPLGQKPIMLRLHSQASIGNLRFWWFFVCNRCRPILRLRGPHRAQGGRGPENPHPIGWTRPSRDKDPNVACPRRTELGKKQDY